MAQIPERRSPLAEAMASVGDRWTLLVVQALLDGASRFNELQDTVGGIASNILAARLRRLEEEGIAISRPYSRRPLRVSYELTASGRELAGALRMLAQWGSGRSDEAESTRHSTCGTPMEARWYCPTCARMVDDAPEGAEAELRYV